ncbi:outer membrane protein assembly factor BamE [Wolbachia endosymbiont of Atemnus politus]|uniref:outer membrane protein assembly factor BamE n=1 Tax=Wolbachia endosymbiont of Atemnus politus TaxID=2682840 RepID=UPI0015741F7A|nr:outer membrane protein assembly factor BamE [Wolbachia endosymbiont of Atemnus politus]NSM56789.1 outer membrane protein assembly factor BamE [Wolbachia endosymbiont of Atemnus politus]NSX83621.1 outer membrane protein assembly factor BamE [Wolbachia endosymbiont of Atemnus politus]
MRILISFFLLFLINCAYTTYDHGAPGVSIELWSKIKVGDDKEKVVHTLGSPTLISKFDENVWYYISYKIKQSNFLGKRKYSSKSLQISFDQDDKVADMGEIDVSERSLAVIN